MEKFGGPINSIGDLIEEKMIFRVDLAKIERIK
jgi:hypothetical protein